MEGADFEDLLTGSLSASLRWQSALPCPCVGSRGALTQECPICHGAGFLYSDFSDPFRAGLISQKARIRAAFAQSMGPGSIGDSVLIVPYTAPCYRDIRDGDRIWDQRVEDRYRFVVIAGTTVGLPFGYRDLQAVALNSTRTGIVVVDPPDIGSNRLISPASTMTISFMAPRGYEVVKELAQVRSFGECLPRKLSLMKLDASLRSVRGAQTIKR